MTLHDELMVIAGEPRLADSFCLDGGLLVLGDRDGRDAKAGRSAFSLLLLSLFLFLLPQFGVFARFSLKRLSPYDASSSSMVLRSCHASRCK
jgi:hypothetical protein